MSALMHSLNQSVTSLAVIGLILAGGLLAVSRLGAEDVSTSEPTASAKAETEAEKPYKPKSKAQLRRELTAMQYNVTQNEGTEPAFANKYWNNKRDGRYDCVVCSQPLFTSGTKFKSGTGWPSFFAPIDSSAVGSKTDWKLFYSRTEIHCSRCKAHLGHVFSDGPRPTGKRYCMNSAALEFVDQKEIDKQEREAAAKKSKESGEAAETVTSTP